jgi:hypothetical protein
MKHQQMARDRFKPGPSSPISVSYALLTRPKEVTEYFTSLGHEVPEMLRSSWVLWAQLPQPIFDHWQACGQEKPFTAVSYCRTSKGANYLVLTHHLASKQHRFLMPLWDEGVMAGVETMRSGCLKFLFQRGDSRDAAIWDVDFERNALTPAFTREPPRDPQVLTSYLGEMAGVIESTMQLDTVPGHLETDVVDEVAVSLLPPVDAVGRIFKGK